MVARLRHLVFFEFDVPSVARAPSLVLSHLDVNRAQVAIGIVFVGFTHGTSPFLV
jgi:hypothetical protein